ncbi:MAG: hypothetical protein C4547_13740 [Phycisphaerales bacterium]|nr:MAG: hypothetical protein C4547_13740 [Phycisphaerales bacterium]
MCTVGSRVLMSERAHRLGLIVALITLVAVAPALARKTAKLTVGDPTNKGSVWIILLDENMLQLPGDYEVEISGDITPEAKAKAIYDALKNKLSMEYDGGIGLTFKNLDNQVAYIQLSDGGTGEVPDKWYVETTTQATVAFQNSRFDPFDAYRQPAVFTAGIVTDVGELTVRISSQELNFQTSGPIICQALFQRLAPRAPQYGAQIQYAGDRLEIYFDPNYTVTAGGVVFGTTSPSPGCSGAVQVPAGGGGNCSYIVKKSKALGGCQVCPPRGQIVSTLESCDDVADCRKKTKATIACPRGPGSCTVASKRHTCE